MKDNIDEKDYNPESHAKRIRNKIVIIVAFTISIIYIAWWFSFSNVGNPLMYGILISGEVFFILTTWGYWFTVWDTTFYNPIFRDSDPTIDIFIPVCGESLGVIEKTIWSVLNMKYKESKVLDNTDRVKIYILNDGFVAKKDNWREVDKLASKYPINVITRQIPGGAKAGNINHALTQTYGEYIVIFDADMKPFPNFLSDTIGYFENERLAFIQTPQFYENYKDNYVTSGAWAQQELFFGPICRGKNNLNSAFCCGTNVLFRRQALIEVNGFVTNNIAEDFATSVNILSKGWKSLYYPYVLSSGLAPMNLEQYYSQQFRWAKGSIDVFFQNNPILKKNLSLNQRLQFMLSLMYYLTGIFVAIDALIPVIFLFTGIIPVKGSPSGYILLFFPYIFFITYILSSSTDGVLNYKALQFSIGSFYIQIKALFASVFRMDVGFKVTSKSNKLDNNNYIRLVIPHLIYIVLGFSAIAFYSHKHGLTPALVTNTSWITFNIIMISAHIYAAFPKLNFHIKNLSNFFTSFSKSIFIQEGTIVYSKPINASYGDEN